MLTPLLTLQSTRLPAGPRTGSLTAHLGRTRRWLLASALGLLSLGSAQAQALNYQALNAQVVSGTYTDLGTSGTVITTPDTDDSNSSEVPIGFNFTYNGSTMTHFILNTNGFIKLGATGMTAPTATLYSSNPQSNDNGTLYQTGVANNVNLVSPFNLDLYEGAPANATEYRVFTTATSPKVTTIQWELVSDFPSPIVTQYSSISFQVKLYEGSNQIDFVYDAATPLAGTTDNFKYAQVGLKGSGTAADQIVKVTKGSVTAWNAATFANGPVTAGATGAFNIRSTVAPAAGLTYRFMPDAGTDAAVLIVYTQGKLATFSPNHVVQATVRNTGSTTLTNLPITLTVSRGGTTLFTDVQTIASLPPGVSSTGSFAAYDAATMANVGMNTVTVSVPADDNTSNNSQALSQDVTTTTVNYASPLTATSGSLSFGAGSGNVGSRFTSTGLRQVNSIEAYIANGTGTVAGVLFDSFGNELGRSATRTLVAGDAGTLITFALTTPIVINTGDFFAGVNLAGGASLGSQTENPTRAGTFYQINAGPALVDLAGSNLGRFNLGAITADAPPCAPVSAVSANTITTNSANVTFTAPGGAVDFTVTYTPAGGGTSTVAPNPTASPVPLSSLQPGTQYTVTVTSNCGAGLTSSTSTGTFTTLPTIDASVVTVYTMGRLPIPYGAPHVVRALVSNNGTTATTIPVTLTVTGPGGFTFTDTQTSASTAANGTATVSFLGYTPTTAGAYTVTVTTGLTDDQLAGNNTQSLAQDVNATTFGYAVVGAPTPGSIGFTTAAASGTLGSRFTSSAARQVTGIRAYIAQAGTATAILYSGTGVELGRSGTFAITAAQAGQPLLFTLTTPVNITAGSFIAAVQITNLARVGSQTEIPTRTGTFYQISAGPTLTDLASSNLGRFYIEAVTATPPACGQVTGLTYTTRTGTSIGIGFTPPAGSSVTDYTVTLTPSAGGSPLTQTVTASPVTFTGLAVGTSYVIRITTNCSGGGGSSAISSATVSTLGNLVVSTLTTLAAASSYNDVTIQNGGTLNFNGNLTVGGTIRIQSGGTLNTNTSFYVQGAGNFVLEAGGTIRVNDAAGLTNSGAGPFNFSASSTFTFSPDANYIFGGTVAQVTGPLMPASARSLTVNNPAGLSLGGPLSVSQLVRLQSGNLATSAANMLTLLSSAAGTALVDNTGGTVTGVNGGTMQRAITGGASLGYRHYASPVSNSPFTDLATAGFSPVLNTDYNSSPTPGLVMPFPNVFAYDQDRIATTVSSYNNFDKGWVVPTTTAMQVGRGYTVNAPSSALVDFTGGTFNNGPQGSGPLNRAPLADAGWHLLGNPYPSPLDWSTVGAAQRPGMDAAVYVFQSNSQYGGVYRSYANGVGDSPIVVAGSGYFVRTTTPGVAGAVNLTNANRVTSFGPEPAFGRGAADTRPQLQLQVTGAGTQDAAYVYFQTGATASVDAAYDAVKLPNTTGLNLATLAGSTDLAINGLPQLGSDVVVPLTLRVPQAGSFTFEVANLANVGLARVYLRDVQAGTEQQLTAGQRIAFSLATATAGTTRFALVFRGAAVTGTQTGLAAGLVSLYPNPAHAKFSVLLPPVAGEKQVQATLFNALGQVVQSRTIALTATGASAEFEVQGLATGIYVLRLGTANQVVNKRVVIE